VLESAFSLSVFAASILAGLLGSLTGLGGGVVVIPVLVLLFGVDLRYAIGASLIAVIATVTCKGSSRKMHVVRKAACTSILATAKSFSLERKQVCA
jgi:uncharacterized membrane protein YfcA